MYIKTQIHTYMCMISHTGDKEPEFELETSWSFTHFTRTSTDERRRRSRRFVMNTIGCQTFRSDNYGLRNLHVYVCMHSMAKASMMVPLTPMALRSAF